MYFSKSMEEALQAWNCDKCGKQLPLYWQVDACTCNKDHWFSTYAPFESLADRTELRSFLRDRFPKLRKHTEQNLVMYMSSLCAGGGIVRIAKDSHWPFRSEWHTYRKALGALRMLEAAGWAENPPAFRLNNGKRMSVLVATPLFWEEIKPLLSKGRSIVLEQVPDMRAKENKRMKHDCFGESDVVQLSDDFLAVGMLEKFQEMKWLNENYFSQIHVSHPSKSIFSNVKLTRIFNKEGMGRLHQVNAGSFHFQALSKEQRGDLLLNGQPTVELDFSGCHLSLVLAEKGIQPPEDPYMPIVVSMIGREDRELRKAVKIGVMLALNTSCVAGKKGSYKQAWNMQFEELAILNRFDLDKMDVLEHMKRVYDIDLCQGRANELMLKESNVMVRILRRLALEGIPSLPVHDSLIVQKEHEGTVKEVMETEWTLAIGFKPRVS